MTESKDIIKKLQDHERRLLRLEKKLGKTEQPRINNDKYTLTDHIIELRNSNFFAQSKTAEETYSKINVKYPCELNRVEVALLRLANRNPKQLRITSKTVNTKKYKAYAW
jgi:hypothetical protein